jgi:hypothetical protein
MKMKKLMTVVFVLVGSILTFTGCDSQSLKDEWQTMTLNQSKPILVDISDGDDSREHGERMFFEAKMSDESGKDVAQLLGMQDIADIPGEDGIGSETMEERFTTMAIVFTGGDEIMISGANIYPMNQRIMQADVPQVRAIIGGTGKY